MSTETEAYPYEGPPPGWACEPWLLACVVVVTFLVLIPGWRRS